MYIRLQQTFLKTQFGKKIFSLSYNKCPLLGGEVKDSDFPQVHLYVVKCNNIVLDGFESQLSDSIFSNDKHNIEHASLIFYCEGPLYRFTSEPWVLILFSTASYNGWIENMVSLTISKKGTIALVRYFYRRCAEVRVTSSLVWPADPGKLAH